MLLTESILTSAGIRYFSLPSEGVSVNRVCHDSRKIEAGALFVGIKTDQRNGSDFFPAALEGGAGALLLDRQPAELPTVPLLVADDPQLALEKLAAVRRSNHRGPVVAVTGSAGKTSTKEFLRAALSARYAVFANRGNFNNRLGLAISLVEAPDSANALILELGTSGPGEISILTRLARPTIAVITLIGYSHLERLHTLDEVLREKISIIEGLEGESPLLVLNGDDIRLQKWTTIPPLRKVYCAVNHEADWRAEAIQVNPENTVFKAISSSGGSFPVQIPLPGKHMVRNCLLALAVGDSLGIQGEDMRYHLQKTILSGGRMRVFEKSGIRWLDDCYNANPDSVSAALTTCTGIPCSGKRWAILGDMLELGDDSARLHRVVGRSVAELGMDSFVAVGEFMRLACDEAVACGMAATAIQWYADSESARAGMRDPQSGDLLLVKGSRGMKMERILEGR